MKKYHLEDIWEMYSKPLYYFLWKLSGSAHAAEDLTRETFVRATVSLHTEEFSEFQPESVGGSAEDLTVLSGIGIVGARTTSPDFRSSMLMHVVDRSSIVDSKDAMLKNMDSLLSKKSATYIENFLGLGQLNKRYSYMGINGFEVCGAVVTGPVKELRKLKDEKVIEGEQFGEVELWI